MDIKELRADGLNVKICGTRQLMGVMAAKEVSARIRELLSCKSEINIVFAAAPSQNEFIENLLNDREISWNCINAFHMDEYIGLDPKAPQGFGNFLRDRILGKAPFKSVHYMDGAAQDVSAECRRYSKLLNDNPVDIVCMGIGENGHIAFNDPPVAKFDDRETVKVVALDNSCRQQQVNDKCFKALCEVPTHALTLTIPALMSCDYVFCIVPSRTKAQAVYNTVKGEVTEKCPASILRTHKNARLYLDAESGSLIL